MPPAHVPLTLQQANALLWRFRNDVREHIDLAVSLLRWYGYRVQSWTIVGPGELREYWCHDEDTVVVGYITFGHFFADDCHRAEVLLDKSSGEIIFWDEAGVLG